MLVAKPPEDRAGYGNRQISQLVLVGVQAADLGRQVVRQDVVGAPEDEVIAVLVHLLLPLSSQLHLLVSCAWLTACQDGPVIVPSEMRWAFKDLGVAEAGHGIELRLHYIACHCVLFARLHFCNM